MFSNNAFDGFSTHQKIDTYGSSLMISVGSLGRQ